MQMTHNPGIGQVDIADLFSEFRAAARVLRLTVVYRRRVVNVEQQARVRPIGILVRHVLVTEHSHLDRTHQSIRVCRAASLQTRTYLDNTSASERLLVLNQHPRHRSPDQRAQQSFSLGFVHTELGTRPQRYVHLAIVLVHQSPQHCRPGVRVLDIVEQKIFEPGYLGIRATG